MENVDEETELDETLVVKLIKSIGFMDDGMKEKKKYVPPKTFM